MELGDGERGVNDDDLNEDERRSKKGNDDDCEDEDERRVEVNT